MMSMKLVVCFGIVTLSLQSVYSDEDVVGKLKELLVPVLPECSAKFGMTKEQVLEIHEKQGPAAIDSCLMACIFKKGGFINDKGLFDKDVATAAVKMNASGDIVPIIEKINEKCVSVNDAAVSDEAVGCDRAKLLVKCYSENNEKVKN